MQSGAYQSGAYSSPMNTLSQEAPRPNATQRELPSIEAIAQMPLFERLGMQRIALVSNASQACAAVLALRQHSVWGFDTESKPTFRVGEVSSGPHILQLATGQQAWVFQLHDAACRQAAADLLAMPGIAKAGFGLGDDKKRIRAKLGVEPAGVIEINTLFRTMGYRKEVGVKAAVAALFGQRFIKSKKASTSNWALPALSEQQLVYAANDAYAAYCVYQALNQATGSEVPQRA
jgi:ribonuclease D